MTQKTLWEEDLADLKTPKHDEIVLGMTKEKVLEFVLSKNIIKPPKLDFIPTIFTCGQELTGYTREDVLESCYFPHGKNWGDSYHCANCYNKTRTFVSYKNCNFNVTFDADKMEHFKEFPNEDYKEWNHTQKATQYLAELEAKAKASILANPPKIKTVIKKIEHEKSLFVPYGGGRFTFDLVAHFTFEIEQIEQKWGKWAFERRYTNREYTREPITIPIYFEIKSAIPSYGELMRQVNQYRNETQTEGWFVVSPDARFKDAIESQGVHFWKW